MKKPIQPKTNRSSSPKKTAPKPVRNERTKFSFRTEDSREWIRLLRRHPEYADKCDWNRLRTEVDALEWARLLRARPEFADKCDWNKLRKGLDGGKWARLVRGRPEFADRCDWSKLGDDDWRYLLCHRPNDGLVSRFDRWDSFSIEDLCNLLCEHPQLKEWCPETVWRRFGLGHWAWLIAEGDRDFAEKMKDLGVAARISDWCCPYHWAEEYHSIFTVQCPADDAHDDQVKRIAERSPINPRFEVNGRSTRYHDDLQKHVQWLSSVAADVAEMAGQTSDEARAWRYALIAEAADYEIRLLFPPGANRRISPPATRSRAKR